MFWWRRKSKGQRGQSRIEELERDIAAINELLKRLKQRRKDGDISESTYQRLYERYSKRKAETETQFDERRIVTNEVPTISQPCSVCGIVIQEGQEMVFCPKCGKPAHYAHLREWVTVKGVCPGCRSRIPLKKLRPILAPKPAEITSRREPRVPQYSAEEREELLKLGKMKESPHSDEKDYSRSPKADMVLEKPQQSQKEVKAFRRRRLQQVLERYGRLTLTRMCKLLQFQDVDQLEEWLLSLPKGTPLRIEGDEVVIRSSTTPEELDQLVAELTRLEDKPKTRRTHKVEDSS